MSEIAWMLGVGREGREAKTIRFGGWETSRTAVGLMDIGDAMVNKSEESHFGWVPL